MKRKGHVLYAGAALALVIPLAAAGLAGRGGKDGPSPRAGMPETVTLAAGEIEHRLPGEFLRDGKPVDAPHRQFRFTHAITIMKYQVSTADYARCVADGACAPLDKAVEISGHIPVTGVNYLDATDYARWFSAQRGETWRLPTDEEWAFVAAERFGDDALGVDEDGNNPSRRWLVRYRLEAERSARSDYEAKPAGYFGANTKGVYDLSGNVWEWTESCYIRTNMKSDNPQAATSIDNCGVRVIEGRHRAYMSTFIRDGKSGGCATGTPPDNMGFRLVREQPRFPLVSGLKGWWLSRAG